MILLCTACYTNKRDFIPYTNKRDWSKPNGYYVGISESESVERGFYKNGEKIGWWFGYLNNYKLYFIAIYKHNLGNVYYGYVDTSFNKLRLKGEVFYSKFKKNICCQTKYVEYYSNSRISRCLIKRLDSSNRFKPYIETYYDSSGNIISIDKYNIKTGMPILQKRFNVQTKKITVYRKKELDKMEADFQKQMEIEKAQENNRR